MPYPGGVVEQPQGIMQRFEVIMGIFAELQSNESKLREAQENLN